MPRHNREPERFRWTEADARRLLTEWATSGQPMAAYARAKGVSAQRLSWWRDRLKGWSAAPASGVTDLQLIPAEVMRAPAAGAVGKVTIQLASGVTVEGFIQSKFAAYAERRGGHDYSRDLTLASCST